MATALIGILVPLKSSFALSIRFFKKVLDAAKASHGKFDPTVGPLLRLWNLKKVPPSVPSPDGIHAALKRAGYQNIQLNRKNHTITCRRNGMELDPGAWGKGYALERCRSVLLKAGITHGVLNFGGNLCIMNKNPHSPDGLWQVGIQRPWSPRGETAGSLRLPPCSVSTSAGYDNFYCSGGTFYHHLIDPRNGQPAVQEYASATVVCSSPLYSDILSTIFFIGGEEEGISAADTLHLREYTGYILMRVDGTEVVSPSLADCYKRNG